MTDERGLVCQVPSRTDKLRCCRYVGLGANHCCVLCGILVALVATIRLQDAWLNGLVAMAHPVGLVCLDMCLFVGRLVAWLLQAHSQL